MSVSIYVPVRTVSEANRRDHWAVKAARVKAQRNAVAWIWRERHDAVPMPAVVTLTRIAPRALDDDNLTGSLKHARDQVADEMGLPNDRDPRVTWRYAQRKGAPGEYAVEIEVSPA